MSHQQQLAFFDIALEEVRNKNILLNSVLEIGSYDVNGSIRKLIPSKDYLGVDLVDGPGVDLIYDGLNLKLDRDFDISVSSECFEHDPNWMNTFKNMIKYTKDGGAIIFTCASKGRLEHGTSRTNPNHSPGTIHLKSEYYQNLNETDFIKAFKLGDNFSDYHFHYEKSSYDLFFIGFLKSNNHNHHLDKNKFISKVSTKMHEINQYNFNKPKGPISKISWLDLPLRKFLLSLKDETLYQNYHIFRRSLERRISAIFKK